MMTFYHGGNGDGAMLSEASKVTKQQGELRRQASGSPGPYQLNVVASPEANARINLEKQELLQNVRGVCDLLIVKGQLSTSVYEFKNMQPPSLERASSMGAVPQMRVSPDSLHQEYDCDVENNLCWGLGREDLVCHSRGSKNTLRKSLSGHEH